MNPEFPKAVSINRAMRAMLAAATCDEVVAAVVLDQLRRERGQ